jgi:biopolymer transport protein ExbD
MKFAHKRKPDPIINVINMVDVFLTLLIFFMMTTTFMSTSGIKIRLPKSGARTAVALPKKPITVYISKLGAIYYKNKQVSLKQLSLVLKSFKIKKENPAIIIKADKASTVADIIDVMGAAIKNGLYKIAIATKKSK